MDEKIDKVIEEENVFGIVIDYKQGKIDSVTAAYQLATSIAKLMAIAYKCGQEGLKMK